MNNRIPGSVETDFEAQNHAQPTIEAEEVKENTRSSMRYNLLAYPKEFLEKYPELGKYNEIMTGMDDDETTVALKIWRATRELLKIKERGLEKKDVEPYNEISKMIEELKNLNNPDFQHFLESQEEELEKVNQLIKEEINVKIGNIIMKLLKVKELGLQKQDVKTYTEVFEIVQELKKLNNPDVQQLLEETEKNLEKANQLIDEEINANRGPVL